MKARVKGTTAIIDVTFNKDALNAGYPPYMAGGGTYYYPEQLVWVDNIDSAEPDYWEKLRYQYVGMAMQGILSNNDLLTALCDGNKEVPISKIVSDNADIIATALVNRLKEESK